MGAAETGGGVGFGVGAGDGDSGCAVGDGRGVAAVTGAAVGAGLGGVVAVGNAVAPCVAVGCGVGSGVGGALLATAATDGAGAVVVVVRAGLVLAALVFFLPLAGEAATAMTKKATTAVPASLIPQCQLVRQVRMTASTQKPMIQQTT